MNNLKKTNDLIQNSKTSFFHYLSKINNNNISSINISRIYEKIFLFIIIIISIFSRFYKLSSIPYTINQDEAFGAYNAYTIYKFGKDSYGKKYPVYLTVWGHGMSILLSLLEIPFIYFLDLNTLSIRLPSAICSIINLMIIYFLIKKFYDIETSLFITFFLSISPYHIMISRWSMDCNIAPYFLTLGIFFFVKGEDNKNYFILSSIFYGLSLYTYANVWLVLPFIILIQMIYFYYINKINLNFIILLFCFILFIFALPLMLFLLVNKNFIKEISLPFMTIPKMYSMRDKEVSLLFSVFNFIKLIYIILNQTDGYLYNSINEYGIFYKNSLFFLFVGFVYCFNKIKEGFFNKKITLEFFLILYTIGGIIIGILISPNINRINIIFIPLIIICSLGIRFIFKKINSKLIIIPIIIYLIQFIFFEHYYFNTFPKKLKTFYPGIDKAINFIINDLNFKNNNKYNLTLHIENDRNAIHAVILFYLKQDVNEYLNNVKYIENIKRSLYPMQYNNIYFYYNKINKFNYKNINRNNSIYLLKNINYKIKKEFDKYEYSNKKFNDFFVFYKYKL